MSARAMKSKTCFRRDADIVEPQEQGAGRVTFSAPLNALATLLQSLNLTMPRRKPAAMVGLHDQNAVAERLTGSDAPSSHNASPTPHEVSLDRPLRRQEYKNPARKAVMGIIPPPRTYFARRRAPPPATITRRSVRRALGFIFVNDAPRKQEKLLKSSRRMTAVQCDRRTVGP